MNPKTVLAALGALTLVAVLSAFAIIRSNPQVDSLPPGSQTFEVAGQVRGMDIANKAVRIAHEEIRDYMPAMTMPFNVLDGALLNGLTAGDRVRFQLIVTESDSWISRIEKESFEDAARPGVAAGAETILQDRELDRVQTGEVVPDFELVDQNGDPIRLKDFRGKAVVLTFVYTRCPIPNFCPLMSNNFADLQARLAPEFPGRFVLLSVSIDPRFDRPEVLKRYAARYDADARHWTFATGEEEQIAGVAGSMGLFHEPENGLISHDLRTALISPDGRLVHLWKSNVWTPYEVQRRVRETLTGTMDVAAR
jgi:protein SCO1/2